MKAKNLVVALAVSAVTPAALASETFSWSGSYEGYVVCDHVADGVPSNFSVSVSAWILQDGDVLHVAVGSDIDAAVGASSSGYQGLLSRSPASEVESGFLEACRPSFPYKELVRLFPTAPTQDRFGFAADTIFVSDSLPGEEGALVVESCMWSFNRISDQVPDFELCDEATSLD